MFELVDVVTPEVSFAANAIDWSLDELEVTVAASNETFAEGDLELVGIEPSTSAISENFDRKIPVEVDHRKIEVSEGRLIIQQPTQVGTRYLIEESSYLWPDSWNEVGRLVGTGFQEFLVSDLGEEDQAFIRITKSEE